MGKSRGGKKGKEQKFDQILEELTSLVEQLENEELPLEESIEAFERGMTLSRQGQKILDAAERRVEVLLRDGETAPLDADSENDSENHSD